MIYSTTITYTSNTLKNLLINECSHSSYIQKEINDKKGDIINIFIAYVAQLIKISTIHNFFKNEDLLLMMQIMN